MGLWLLWLQVSGKNSSATERSESKFSSKEKQQHKVVKSLSWSGREAIKNEWINGIEKNDL